MTVIKDVHVFTFSHSGQLTPQCHASVYGSAHKHVIIIDAKIIEWLAITGL